MKKGRRWLPSLSISGRLGSMRFDDLAAVAAAVLIVVVILTPAADAQTCASITDSQVDCLFAAPSRPNAITIDCISIYYKISVLSASIYQAADSVAGCPSSAPVNTTAIGACFQRTTVTCASSSSSTCFYAVSTPSSSVSGTTCTGPYFVVTTYQCLAMSSTANTTTSSSTFMDNPNKTSNTEVSVGNPSPVDNINFYGPTNYFCSIYVPAGLELVVGYKYIIKSNPDCNWRIQIDDVTNNAVAVFCNSTSPSSVNLGCGSNPAVPRYLALRYIGDNSTSIFFAAYFRVRQGSQVTVQCGLPPFPLYSTPPPATTTVAPTTPPAPTLPATTLPPPAVTTAAVAASTATISTPTPSTPVFPTSAPASTNPPAATTAPLAPTLPATTLPPPAVTTAAVAVSTAAISTPTPSTPVLPTSAPASTNPPAAPATSVAVTSGAPTTGDVTSTAPNAAVTTAPLNNAPTSAPPLVPPTTASPPAAADTSAITSSAVPSPSPTGLPTISISGGVQTATPSAGGVSSGWDTNATIGVVVGSVVAGAIVLSIVAAVALYRRSVIATTISANAAALSGPTNDPQVTYIEPVRSTNYQLDAQAYNTGPYRNVTGFYVDGNSRSNLVISRQPPVPPQPFKTVLRLQ